MEDDNHHEGTSLPPPYAAAAPIELSINSEFLSDAPVSLRMVGEYRSPDFAVLLPNGLPLFGVNTESSRIAHQMRIIDARYNRSLFTIHRKGADTQWQYSASSRGRNGCKLLEVETDSTMLAGSLTRLVFRNAKDGELDGVTLKIDSGASYMEVLYQGRIIGLIRQERNSKKPEFSLHMLIPGIDPLLLVIFVLVADDRSMTDRRRWRRPVGAGFAGIGRGPGALLASAYALGS